MPHANVQILFDPDTGKPLFLTNGCGTTTQPTITLFRPLQQ
jgi:hypothetical protein